MIHPKENRTQPACILIEQFRQKGYVCLEVKEKDSTILILRHEKKYTAYEVNSLVKNLVKN